MTTEVLRIELQDTGGKQTRASLEKTGGSVEGLGSRVKNLTGALGGYRTILTAIATGAAGRFVTDTLSQVDAIGKFSDKIGASVEALSEYRHVTSLAEVDFKTFQKALETSTIRISEAAAGSGAAKKALEELQIPIKQITELSADEQFEAVSEAMQGVENQSRRLKLAYDIFGRSGTDVLKIINQGTDAIDEQREAAREMGGQLTQENVKAAAEFNDAMERLTRTFSSFGEQVVLVVAGPLTSLLDTIRDIIETITGAVRAVKEFAQGLKNDLTSALTGTLGAMIRTAAGLNDVAAAEIEVADAGEEAARGLDASTKAATDYLKPLDAVKKETVVMVDLLSEQATQALILEQATERLRMEEEAAAQTTRERTVAVTGLVASIATLAGVVTPDQVGSILGLVQSAGTLFGVSGDQLASIGAAGSVGAVGGALVGGGGTGAAVGGALGAIAGSFLGPLGTALGAAAGGLIGGMFDSENQPSVTFATQAGVAGAPSRGRFGQRTFVSEGALGLNIVGARDGGSLTPELIAFADTLTSLDDAIGGFVDGQEERLQAARAAAQSISNETNAANFDPAENIRIRFSAIFDAIGGIEDELFDAFSPDGEFVPQVVAAIEVLRNLGETSQQIAKVWDETDENFLSAIGSLQFLNDVLDQDDPVGRIRDQIAELGLTVEELQSRQSQSLIELAQSYDGSIEATNQMASSVAALEQVTAQTLIGIDRARSATNAGSASAIKRIRQSGLSATEVFSENRAQAQSLLGSLESGTITSAAGIQSAVSEINSLLSSGFFGLDQSGRDAQRESTLSLLEDARATASKQFDAQEARARREHEAALQAAADGLAAAAALNEAAANLNSAADNLSDQREVA
jgi:adenosyl cobinamide kinase/adenosyl cobinamide phosphate guanylyltransferase